MQRKLWLRSSNGKVPGIGRSSGAWLTILLSHALPGMAKIEGSFGARNVAEHHELCKIKQQEPCLSLRTRYTVHSVTSEQ